MERLLVQALKAILGRYDTQHNDTQHNDTQHNDTQHNDAQHYDIHHNETQRKGFICDTQRKWQLA